MVGVKGLCGEIQTGTLGISYFSEVFASLVSVPGQRPEFGVSPGLHAESTADGADVSSDQPPLWTREKDRQWCSCRYSKYFAPVSRALPTPPKEPPGYSPRPFPPGIFHCFPKASLQPCSVNYASLYHFTCGVCR